MAAGNMEPRLVVLSRGPELYSTRRLATEAEKSGWIVDIVDPLALTIVVDEDGGRVFHKGWPVECEAVLPRIGYSITRRGVAIVRQFEQMGVIVLNSSQGIIRSRDKLVACQMMAEKRVPVPITAHVGAWEDTDRAVRRVGGTPCVVKSTEGTHGSGVFLINSFQQARQLVYQMLERGMRPLVQEYIEESHGSDVRALVVGGDVVASMRRKAHGSEFRSNFHLGGSVSKVELTDEQKEIAVTATKTLGLELAGVDMLESQRGPLVLEVNSSPGLEGIESSTRINVAAKVAERITSIYESLPNLGTRADDVDVGIGSERSQGTS
jgi:ribosomal protein S6--L-glutamate ligase